MPSILHRLLSDERAVTAIEYSLVALLIAIAGIAAMLGIAGKLVTLLDQVIAAFP